MQSFTQKNNNRRPLRELLPVAMPLGMCIEPTNLCNFKCIQCPVSLPLFKETVGELGHMSMELYGKLMGDIKEMGTLRNMNLYGDGEPFLNPDLLEMVRLAKSRQSADAITITTNGSLLDEKINREIIESGLDYLRVSIYSVYEEKHLQVTGSKVPFSRVYDNISHLSSLKKQLGKVTPFIYVKMIDTYCEENELFRERFAPIADETNIETPMNWNGYNNIDLISRIDSGCNTDQTTLQGYYGGTRQSGMKQICTTPFLSLNVKRNGDVVICIVDWNKGTVVGNIGNESLKEIWYGRKLREFREMHIEGNRRENESCRNCNFLYCNPDNMDGFSRDEYARILNFNG